MERDLIGAADVLDTFVVEAGAVSGADAEGTLVATASGRHDTTRFPGLGYIHWVAVAPRARGQGLGVAGVSVVLRALRGRGYTQAVLETDDDRLPAIAGYLRLGFVPIYRDPDHLARWSEVMRSLGEHRGGRLT
ncbi:GNAT family N-acetyltransferase [Occultella kanbiaonis]|uniref:GNAT family N-acetyltransferase n=1 Tax=Occultella kanbiaonis TaxID=2675754 RepID=UPI0013D3C22B|nr:GNAT family N-acetyltransferase [Occultella kanbiaonis]